MKLIVLAMLLAGSASADLLSELTESVGGCGGKVSFERGSVRVLLPNKLQFDSGSVDPFVGVDSMLCLVSIIKKTDLDLKIIGYADPKGSASENILLSNKRASNVKKLIVSYGVSPDRITTEGRGEADLLSDKYYMRIRNRRVELEFILK